MSFVNLNRLKNKFKDGLMKENVENIIEFDLFHCLLSSDETRCRDALSYLGKVSDTFLQWLRICDGGLLFDTVMLSTKERDTTLGLDFDTYEELNSEEAKISFDLPDGFAVFAVRSYGDPLCVDVWENDGMVYLWNVEKREFETIWNTFEDWMFDEIDDALNLIADDVLDPITVKLEAYTGDDDE